jgi:hypothetical protein
VELQERLPEIQKQGLGVAAISYDAPGILKNFAGRRGITFPLLSDEGSKVIRAFGILNEEVPAGTMFAGVPYPGTYIVDPAGKVVAKYFEDDYTERFTASEILVRQYGAAAGASHETSTTKHLTVSSAASSARVRSGQRIALTLDVELRPKMHVYAPGVEGGYIPIAWTMTGAHDVTFPPSRKLRLPAINETVPVFEGKFRLMRDFTVPKSAKPGELVIDGTLRYQACDDKICYTPETVPLKWMLKVEPHDRERAK